MLSHQRVVLFERIRGCAPVGEVVALLGEVFTVVDFEISEAQVRSSGSVFLLSEDLDVHQLHLQLHICLHVTMLLAMMTIDKSSTKAQLNVFFY